VSAYRKAVKTIIVLAFIGMAVVPPWYFPILGDVKFQANYAPLWDPPHKGPLKARINAEQLIAQWGAVILIGGIFFLWGRQR